MPIDELAIPGRHNVSNALAAVAVGLLFGIAPDAIRRAAAAFTRRRAPPRAGRRRSTASASSTTRRAPSRTRSIAALRAFEPPIVLIAGGRDKGVDLSALAPVVAERAAAAVLIGESGPTLEALFRRRRPGRHRAGGDARGGRPRPPTRSPASALAAGDARARDRAAEPGRRQLRHVRGLRRPRPGVQGGGRAARRRATRAGGPDERRPAPPTLAARARARRIVRDGRRRRAATPATARTPARQKATALKRERHQADYAILVVVVALTAIGILMVYSSSAMKAYIATDDTLAIVGPQIGWAALGLVAMVGHDAGRLPLSAVRVGAGLRRRARAARPRLRPEPERRRRRLRPLAEGRRRCRPSTRPRSRSSR